jgi:predicted amidohydrolase YtcJ
MDPEKEQQTLSGATGTDKQFNKVNMFEEITVLTAKKIITMSSVRSEAEAVAVRNGKILGVGTIDELKGWGKVTIDDTFKDKTLIPGLIEGHCHIMEGVVWQYPYVGYYDRVGPDGKHWQGCTSLEEVIAALKKIDASLADPEESLIAWGLDPIYFKGERLCAKDLDKVSTTRPIFVVHASFHIATVNTALLKKEGITRNTEAEGVPKASDGEPLGELQETGLGLAMDHLMRFFGEMGSPLVWKNIGLQAKNSGCTTLAELGTSSPNSQEQIEHMKAIIDAEDFPVRVVAAYMPPADAPDDPVAAAQIVFDAKKQSSDKLRFGIVKLILDGSIQGYTARVNEPGYFNGKPNGLWMNPPEQIANALDKYHQAGLTVFCHCNGDEAVDVFLDAVEQAQVKAPWPDARHTIQHCQVSTSAQYQRMANLGVCANIFANHIYYWGDQHYETTMGPDRAERMEACATAKRAGVHFTLHSDAAVTPLGQLHTAWCAVNRLTASGRVLGEEEKISVYDALYSVTMGAAYQMKMDHEIGSIEPGKWADFTVLEEDPFTIDPIHLKDIDIWGTVLAGKPFKTS